MTPIDFEILRATWEMCGFQDRCSSRTTPRKTVSLTCSILCSFMHTCIGKWYLFCDSTWFGLRHARLKVVVLQPTVVSRFGCFVFEFWVLRFRDFGAWCFCLHFRVLRFWNYSAPKCSNVSYTLWKMDEHVHVVCLVPPTIKWFHSCTEMPEHFGALVNVTGRNWICQKQENRIFEKLKFQVQFWAVH